MYGKKQLVFLRSDSKRLENSTRRLRNNFRLTLLKKTFKAESFEANQVSLDKHNILAYIWFTDESWFYSDGIAQRNNQLYWALIKAAVKPVQSFRYKSMLN